MWADPSSIQLAWSAKEDVSYHSSIFQVFCEFKYSLLAFLDPLTTLAHWYSCIIVAQQKKTWPISGGYAWAYGAQLSHFCDQNIVDLVFGPPGIMLYNIQRVVLRVSDFATESTKIQIYIYIL